MSRQDEHEVVFTARERAELVPCRRPPGPPGDHEVEGRTLATVVSTGTELACFRGDAGELPARPGYAAAFQVEEVGREVRDLKPGDTALCPGPHRSFQRRAGKEVLAVPKGLPPERAVFARLCGVSMTTLVTTSARPPAKVVVTGLGPIGHLAAQIFQGAGYEVTAVDPVEARRGFAREAGIADVRESVPLDDPVVAGRVALVVECSGHEGAVLDGCRVVRKGGEVVLVGSPWRRRTDISAHEVFGEVFRRYVVLRSGWEWEVPRHEADFARGSIFGNLAAALRWLAEGRVRVEGLYEMVSPREAADVYRRLHEGGFGKLAAVFDWGRAAVARRGTDTCR
jgi:threonine dehydrogenase-like Zn-dependent dehydrogenase